MIIGFQTSGKDPTSFAGAIGGLMNSLCPIEEVGGGLRITTNCLYPSNGLVRVIVRGGMNAVAVADDGEAVGEALAAGIELRDADKLLRDFMKRRGVIIRQGVILAPTVPFNESPVAILQVANAAKDAANWLYDHGDIKRRHDFRELLTAYLSDRFRNHLAHGKVVGSSNKFHNFPNIISFANGRRLLVDPVAKDPSSVNARVVANLDVKSLKDDRIEQRIIYDDEEAWSAEDLNLLKVGATIIPYRQAASVIERLAFEMQDAA